MTSLPDPNAAVSQRLESFVAVQRSQTRGLGDEAAQFLDSAASVLDGGKRLRARFLAAGWAAARGSSATPGDDVTGVAAALEIFHAAALVHDDLVDNSDTRRGRPSAHRALESRHAALGWRGDADAFGRAAAILLGDLLISWSDDLLEESIVDNRHAGDVRRQYSLMRRDVTIGQFLDVAEEAASVTAPDSEHAERARRVASYKSARYSVQQPLLIGAALGGADDGQRAGLARFGHAVGLAFQLRDDVLGVFGDAAVTGKPSGDDLREGKRTVLIARTREAVDPERRAALDALLGDRSLDADQIAALQRMIVDSGALAEVEAEIAALEVEADAALADTPIDPVVITALRTLGEAAIRRKS
ncbi:polyprenyl synthetase family protein [Microbacterium radiodurans]|uniref:Polyprenyl synthetase family protein n=1 Tax=Microbacterium radiodurans TaxID=661398 RepID=A0A5J5IU44_9MICO|nr:polyprenyl synthetase family protein [Microbacterium radiodurans]